MQKNNTFLYVSIFVITLQLCFHDSVLASEQTVQLKTRESLGPIVSVTSLEENLKVLNNVGTCYLFVSNVYELGQNVYKLCNPSQERQDHLRSIKEQLELIQLRRDFVTCLVENRTNTLNVSLGIPSQCEYAAFLLGSSGAVHETERIITTFNKYK